MVKPTGITDDSKKVGEGFVFVAVVGINHDGHNYINQAVKNGAVEVIGEKPRPKDLSSDIKYRQVASSRKALGRLASEFYSNPSKKIKVIGVTGTKGKTTTSHMIAHILKHNGLKTGLVSSISTLGYHVTTPGVVDLQKNLSKMVKKGCKYAVVEVSSHGIDQGRIEGIDFSVTVLTNIKPEHLDYHKTFLEYKKTKLRFLKSGKIQITSPTSTAINIFPGEFNNINAQTAVEIAVKLGIKKDKALRSLQSFKLPVGRMEEIETGKGIKVFVDFAHTPDSLEKALTYLKTLTKGRLISVFGCAGERDIKKRSQMGQISTRLADLSVFTSEDPRSENVVNITKSIEHKARGSFVSIPERAEAIYFALKQARKGDVVGIFGKGHEKSMCWDNFEHPWSDQEMVSALLKEDKDISTIVLAAGKGTRMKSENPKVLKEICGRPMLAYTLENLRRAGIGDITLVVGFRKEEVLKRFPQSTKFVVQKNPKGGTADAAKTGLKAVSNLPKHTMVINGDDSAFYKFQTFLDIISSHRSSGAVVSFVTLVKTNPFGLGRIIRDSKGVFKSIVEEKDATEEQRKITEVNDGLYIFQKEWLEKNIKRVKKGPQGEYYLVDLAKLAVDEDKKVLVYKLPDDSQWHGINTPQQLSQAEEKMRKRLNYDNVKKL